MSDSDTLANFVVLIGLAILMLITTALIPPRPTAAELCAEHSWSDHDCQRIADQIIWLGMTDEQARLSWGPPTKTNRSVGSWGVHEQWVYRYKYSSDYLYFENGILTSWQR